MNFEREVFPDATVQKGIDESRRESRHVTILISLNNSETTGWSPSLVDADWHVISQDMYKDFEEAEWDNLCFKFTEVNEEILVRTPSGKL